MVSFIWLTIVVFCAPWLIIVNCERGNAIFRQGALQRTAHCDAGKRQGRAPHPPAALPSFDLGDGKVLDLLHGTTTLAFVFSGGIIAAVDSRASLGSLVGSHTTDKVLPVSGRILATMAGGAADCGYWIRVLAARIKLWELDEGRDATAAAAAHLLVSMLRANRGLAVGTMIMGFDADQKPWLVDILLCFPPPSLF